MDDGTTTSGIEDSPEDEGGVSLLDIFPTQQPKFRALQSPAEFLSDVSQYRITAGSEAAYYSDRQSMFSYTSERMRQIPSSEALAIEAHLRQVFYRSLLRTRYVRDLVLAISDVDRPSSTSESSLRASTRRWEPIVTSAPAPGVLVQVPQAKKREPFIFEADLPSCRSDLESALQQSLWIETKKGPAPSRPARFLHLATDTEDPYDAIDALIHAMTEWSPLYIAVAATPETETLVAPAPLEATSGTETSTVGAFAHDRNGKKVVTLAYHGTGDPGTTVDIDGHATVVSEADPIVDAAIAPFPWSASLAAGVLQSPIGQSAAVEFSGFTSGSVQTVISGTDVDVPHAPQGVQVKVYTPRVVNHGDSGSALLTTNRELVGFAFRKTKRGQPISYASWIWALSVYTSLQLS